MLSDPRQLTLNEFSVDVRVGPGGEALQDHDGRDEEQLLADVEHELGRARRNEVDHVLHSGHVSLAAVDLKNNSKL